MPRTKTTERKPGSSGADAGDGKKKKGVSRNEKAGLTLPVSRVARIMKREGGTKRVGRSAPVYLSAVAEYVAAELLEIAGNHAIKNKRKRVTPEDIAAAIRIDKELNLVCGNLAFAVDGVVKGVTKAITPGATKPSKPAEKEPAPKTPSKEANKSSSKSKSDEKREKAVRPKQKKATPAKSK